jgi:Tfp pilus assembly protein PilF
MPCCTARSLATQRFSSCGRFSRRRNLDARHAFPAQSFRDSIAGEEETVSRFGPQRKSRAGLLAACLCLTACAGEPAPPALPSHATGLKVVLIGWDGADWSIARPLMAQGRLPNLQRLVERGASGELHSMVPTLSPLLWTTVATGQPPEVHGVLDFLQPGTSGGLPRPITAAARQVPALWEMANAAGRSAGVVGWWATHPAPPLHGFAVSDSLAYTLMPDDGDRRVPQGGAPPGSVEPAAMRAAVRRQVVLPQDVPEELLQELGAGADVPQAPRRRLAELLSGTLTYQRAALLLLAERGQPDLLMLYYQGIDQVSHRFIHCAAPAMDSCPVSERGPFGRTVEQFYGIQDRLLGELLEVLDPETLVLLVSDHGFLSGPARPRYVPPDVTGQPGRWHRRQGLFALAGPPVARDEQAAPLSLLEIAPTLLATLGLPVGQDMVPPRLDLLRAEFVERFPLRTLSTWSAEIVRHEDSPSDGEEDGQRRMRELTALGYISGESARSAADDGGPRRTVAAQVNLASRWLQIGSTQEAEGALEQALGVSPDYPPAWMGMSEVRARQGRAQEAAQALARAVQLTGGARADPSLLLRWTLRAGNAAQLAPLLDQALALRPASADLLAARGILRGRGGQVAAARRDLRAALQLRPAHPESLATLFALRAEAGGDALLQPALRRALQAEPGAVMPRNWLALLLEQQGSADEAEDLLREAVALAPRHAGTRVNLGSLLGRAGRPDAAAEQFRWALEIDTDDLTARLGLATAEAQAGRPQQARQVLQKATPAQRDDVRLLNTLALVYRDLGQRENGAGALRRSLAIRQDQPAVRDLLQELEESP